MTGERFTLSEVPFQDGPFDDGKAGHVILDTPVRAVTLTNGLLHGSVAPYLRKLSGTPFVLDETCQGFLMVVTLCDDEGVLVVRNTSDPVTQDGPPPFPGDERGTRVAIGNGKVDVWVDGFDSGSFSVRGVAEFTNGITGNLRNFIICVLAPTMSHPGVPQYQCVIDDTFLSPGIDLSFYGDLWNPGLFSGDQAYWWLMAPADPDATVRVVRFWMAQLSAPVDLSDPAVRRPFVSATGVPVPLPDDGHVAPYGVPIHYLHARTNPGDFADIGIHAWDVVNGPLAFDLAACFMPR